MWGKRRPSLAVSRSSAARVAAASAAAEARVGDKPRHPRLENHRVAAGCRMGDFPAAESPNSVDAHGWIGGDFHRFWWKADVEQETRSPKAGEFDFQALYGRMIHPFWDAQAGVRLDRRYSGPERDTRTHVALGLQGTAPYWFEVEPTLFLRDDGDVSFELSASFEQLITQRLVIEPRIDVEAAFQDDHRREIGAGFNEVEFGLRLRYEFTRQLAPYAGVTWRRALGETAGLRRRVGEKVSEWAVVFGLRVWF